ncbi:MAG: SDR family oxidoreductase [Rhizobiales bacterium]|nr:SDR family oxidoreductase [Hyphomicrobiales bacterium]
MRIAVLGASGLIGEAVTRRLRAAGLPTLALARGFTPAQRAAFGVDALETPLVDLAPETLARLFQARDVGVVVNCVGALQASGKGDPARVHAGFVARLLDAMGERALIHISMPGQAGDDPTDFSRTKRAADADIAARASRYAILRPGFVVAPTPYGASALLRALAQTPFDAPAALRARPFAPVAVADVAETVEALARRGLAGESFAVSWDLCAQAPATLGDALDAFRRRVGAGPARWTLPSPSIRLGGVAADLVARLGWLSPLRSTALAEIARGVAADPSAWIAATGARPRTLETMTADIPADVAAIWFARLYALKPVVVTTLAAFWIVSGLIALGPGFTGARDLLVAQGASAALANAFTLATALADILVGALIAARRTHRLGLAAGFALACAYLAGATLIAPALWLDPLGPLVKVFPALALSLVAWAIFPDR